MAGGEECLAAATAAAITKTTPSRQGIHFTGSIKKWNASSHARPPSATPGPVLTPANLLTAFVNADAGRGSRAGNGRGGRAFDGGKKKKGVGASQREQRPGDWVCPADECAELNF
eukprot:gene26069-549_t